MKMSLIALALVGAFAAPAFAEEAAAPASEHTITGNLTLASSYRFRGIDQTFGKPALQGGVDYSHESGFYAGNWNSNVSSGAGFPDGNLEMDFYGGWKKTWGDWGLDVGAILYYYPGSEGRNLGTKADSGAVTNKELYIGGSWKTVSLKYYHSVDDYFSLRGWDANGNSTGKSTKGKYIPALMFCYNTSYHRSIKTSPFFLTFGIEARTPAFFAFDVRRFLEDDHHTALQRLAEAKEIAIENNWLATEKYKEQHDRKAEQKDFHVGQFVLLDNFNFLNKNRKLAEKFSGPLKIIRLKGDNNTELNAT